MGSRIRAPRLLPSMVFGVTFAGWPYMSATIAASRRAIDAPAASVRGMDPGLVYGR